MTKPFTTILLFLMAIYAYGQTCDLNVVASSGGNAVTPGINANWTVGESFTTELTNNTFTTAQGFHQGAVAVMVSEVNEPVTDDTIIAYPNPTRDHIVIQLNAFTSRSGWSLKVLTINGKVAQRQVIESEKTDLDFTKFPNGTYLISISNNAAFSKAFTVIKQ